MLQSVLLKINRLPLWQRRVRVWDSIYNAPTFDRLASLHAHRLGWMGDSERRFLNSVVRHDSIVADVGANQGLYALWLARVAAKGHVYAFEPDPELFEFLKQNIRDNRLTNISPIPAAVNSQPGTVAFTANKLNRGDNRVVRNSASGSQRVKAVTIDEVFAHSRLDLLKIDVQGFEIEVLLGAQRTLRNNQHLIIIFEFWPYGLRQAGYEPDELPSLLKDAEFSITALSRDGKLTALTQEIIGWQRKEQYCNLVAHR